MGATEQFEKRYVSEEGVLISKLFSLSLLIIGFILIGPIMGIIGLALVMVLSSVTQTGILAASEINTKRRLKKDE